MAQEDNWLDKRQRAVKCKIHGLHYDPQMTSGCTLCRKEGLEAVPPQKPQLVLMLLSLLGVALILYRILGPGDVDAGIPQTEDEAPAVALGTSAPFDVAPYRGAIKVVEKAVFEPQGSDLGTISEQIAMALAALARQLAEDPEGRTSDAVKAVEEFSGRIAGTTLDLAMLQDVRVEWDRLRRRHFGNQTWYVRLAAVDERTDRAALSAYRDVASDLLVLLDQGTSLARTLHEPTAPNLAQPDEEARKREEWRSFQSEWQAQIKDLKDRLPGRPAADTDPQVLLAAQRLDDAFRSTSSLASASGLPSLESLNTAFDTVERAQRSFDDLLSR